MIFLITKRSMIISLAFVFLVVAFGLAPVFALGPTDSDGIPGDRSSVQNIANNIKATAITHDQTLVQINLITLTGNTFIHSAGVANDSSTILFVDNALTQRTLAVFQFYDSPMSYITSNIEQLQAVEVPYTILLIGDANTANHFIFV